MNTDTVNRMTAQNQSRKLLSASKARAYSADLIYWRPGNRRRLFHWRVSIRLSISLHLRKTSLLDTPSPIKLLDYSYAFLQLAYKDLAVIYAAQ